MCESKKVIQKAIKGTETTQIVEQNNYYGMTAEEVSRLAIGLFMDNFPKLQEEAQRVAQDRVEEFCQKIIQKLQEQGKTDFGEFSDPDMQFILNKSQHEYARFGTNELLELLSEIIINRVNYNNDYYMKIILDEAIDIAKSLSDMHLNYLSLTFLCKHAIKKEINSVEALKEHCEYICTKLPVPCEITNSIPLLNMLRLLEISVGFASDVYSENYNLDLNEVKEILPNMLNSIPADYRLSPVGIVIAIINIHRKTDMKLNIETWIKNI